MSLAQQLLQDWLADEQRAEQMTSAQALLSERQSADPLLAGLRWLRVRRPQDPPFVLVKGEKSWMGFGSTPSEAIERTRLNVLRLMQPWQMTRGQFRDGSLANAVAPNSENPGQLALTGGAAAEKSLRTQMEEAYYHGSPNGSREDCLAWVDGMREQLLGIPQEGAFKGQPLPRHLALPGMLTIVLVDAEADSDARQAAQDAAHESEVWCAIEQCLPVPEAVLEDMQAHVSRALAQQRQR